MSGPLLREISERAVCDVRGLASRARAYTAAGYCPVLHNTVCMHPATPSRGYGLFEHHCGKAILRKPHYLLVTTNDYSWDQNWRLGGLWARIVERFWVIEDQTISHMVDLR